jgi:hypothetical protein
MLNSLLLFSKWAADREWLCPGGAGNLARRDAECQFAVLQTTNGLSRDEAADNPAAPATARERIMFGVIAERTSSSLSLYCRISTAFQTGKRNL